MSGYEITQHTTHTGTIGALTGRDVSGFEIFSSGAAGVAHDIAHQMLDQGEHEAGYQMLGAWLESNDGAGSEWVHLQWHQGVFEIALGFWDEAYERCCTWIVPAAVEGDEALTDAPAMLWRLALAAPRAVELPWEAVRARATRSLERSLDPYVELHQLLALAGGGDIAGLDVWLERRTGEESPCSELLCELGSALRAFAMGDYATAGWLLTEAAPRVSELGGSRAQNDLFTDIERACWRMA